MPSMTKRVHVLLTPRQHARLERIARAERTSVGALIRRALDEQYLDAAREKRVRAAKRLADLSLPVGDWQQMERESREQPCAR